MQTISVKQTLTDIRLGKSPILCFHFRGLANKWSILEFAVELSSMLTIGPSGERQNPFLVNFSAYCGTIKHSLALNVLVMEFLFPVFNQRIQLPVSW